MNDHSGTETLHQATLQSDDDKKLSHYEKVREDVRNEIKLRMRQRDRFAIHLITMLTLLFAVAFAEESYNLILVAAPMLSVFYTLMILHSYRKHDLLARYLREVIEPELAMLCRIDPAREWQSYSYKMSRYGSRRAFFLWVMWVVCTGLMAYLWFNAESAFQLTFYIFSGVYLIAMLCVTLSFIRDTTGRSKGRHRGAGTDYSSAAGAYLS
ncbi:hypothetical protein [Cohnella luojiensis]|uniref:Uncharacterized protein n=1 Tax=Cohnella luojiensis TaxID=652876 RepID=A0A4Y8LSR9_9BACL|nr:hypothetical protein [Cohnella luojiensis]TFE24539.1 hypothetical protein E2980_15950 [Cohnella luojiensis]